MPCSLHQSCAVVKKYNARQTSHAHIEEEEEKVHCGKKMVTEKRDLLKKKQGWYVCCARWILYVKDNKSLLQLCLCGLGYSATILHFNF